MQPSGHVRVPVIGTVSSPTEVVALLRSAHQQRLAALSAAEHGYRISTRFRIRRPALRGRRARRWRMA